MRAPRRRGIDVDPCLQVSGQGGSRTAFALSFGISRKTF